jgi:outer membrane protein
MGRSTGGSVFHVQGAAMIRIICICLVAIGLPATAWCRGAETKDEAKDKRTVYFGGGALISTKPYIGMDARVYPVPLFAYEGKRWYMRGLIGGYRLLAGEGWSIGPVVQPRFDGYEESDSSALEGMDDRDWSVDAGVVLSWLTEIGLFGLSFVTDTLGKHDGQELEFNYTILFPLGKFDFIPSAGMRWKSENLVGYYYGVRPSEARAGRPAYEGDNALDPFVRVAVRHKLAGRWSLLAAVQYEWLDGEITDSPIVDADGDASFMIGALYSW